MTFSPRWVALAAVIALSVSAAAQSDASFAAALGKLPPGLAVMAQLKTLPQKPAAVAAQAQGPTAPADVWLKVFQTTVRYGKREPISGTPGFSYTREEFESDPAKNWRLAMTVNFLVVPADKGMVSPVTAQFIASGITYDPKKKEARTEWSMFEADGSGQLIKAAHGVDITRSATDKTEGAPENLDLSASDTKEEFEALLDWWLKR